MSCINYNWTLLGAIGLLVLVGPVLVAGHGRMVEPAARNAMWRYNYKNPRNYNDMGLNCGGFTNQFERQRGKCGVCGDPFEGPRDHEAGGKYARGLVARQYKMGTFINVTVELTSNHKGYFEFRLCPVNDPHKKATQTCMDQNLLNIVGHGTRYFITRSGASVYVELIVMLPPKLKCSQCVMQWKWVAGQSMGPDGYGGECLGCGNQEHFINCADIAIGTKAVNPLPPLPGSVTPAPPAPGTANLGPVYKAKPSMPAAGANLDVSMASLVKQIYNQLSGGAAAPSYASTPKPWTPAPPTWNNNQLPAQPAQNTWQQNPMQSMFGELFGWMTPESPNPATVNYPGYEPGEYPEVGETPTYTPGRSSHQTHQTGHQQTGNNYAQGYNDAMMQIQEQFGMGGMGGLNTKVSPAFNEISMSLQDAQKRAGSGGHQHGAAAGKGCMDGSEMDCRASNTMFASEFDSFCQSACSAGQCLSDMCLCTCPGGQAWSGMGTAHGATAGGANCRSLDRSKAGSMDRWCSLNCKQNNCPPDMCVCG